MKESEMFEEVQKECNKNVTNFFMFVFKLILKRFLLIEDQFKNVLNRNILFEITISHIEKEHDILFTKDEKKELTKYFMEN